MSILVHRATDEIDRLEMFALAKSEEGQSVLIARIEHLESVLKETKGYLIESKVKIKELEQDIGDLNQECDGFERDLYENVMREYANVAERLFYKGKQGSSHKCGREV
jgi:septal ring factor EnvC (AmiA/AmiB activator)